MMLHSESSRIERLIGLCRLWAAIKYFHPYLAYRDNIDWDAALIAAIPGVNAANNANEYAVVVQGMLNTLGDSATQVVQEVPADSFSHERQPSFITFLASNILIVTINSYQDLMDIYGTLEKMAAIKKEIPKARGLLFDLRAKAPLSQERGYLSLAFQWSEIASSLSSTPLVTGGERSRMHLGFVPQKGVTSGDYTSAFRVVDGRRILPAPEAKDIPIVFLVNAWSELPSEALALQIAGKAAILIEGNTSDALKVKTHRIQLSDKIEVEMRLSEVVCEDSSRGFVPDIIIPEPQILGEGDQAFTTALELLKDFKPQKIIRAPLPAHASSKADLPYAEMTLPPLEHRVLAAFRIWAVINYFFPYKELMGEDWENVLREFIPRMEQADNAEIYHLTVAEMITHIHDSHGYIDSAVLRKHFGPAWPPVRLQIVENVPVITTIYDEEAAKSAGVNYGDIVLNIDGEDAMSRIDYRAKYQAASTPQRVMYQAAYTSLAGPEGSFAILTLRDRDDRVKEAKLPRKVEYGNLGLPGRSGEVIRLISDDIGYVDLDRLEVPMVNEMFERFKNTKAIIFDMRGYPKGTAWKIAPRLTDKNGVRAALFQCPVVMMPDGPNDDIASQSITYSFVQLIPPAENWHYKGKTVMLIDERTISQAEHTGLFFEAANGTKFIGSHTAGANGDVTNFFVPGGINIMFTGQSVRHVDGRQLQRIGLVPDVEVKPTINGIQNGKDEVLSSAIEYLQHEFEGAKRKN